MHVYLQWLAAASAFCLVTGWLGYRAFHRAASKREAERARAEAADWAEAQRLAEAKATRHRARSEAAAQEAAREAGRVAAAEAERIEAAVVAAHEVARAHAEQLAAEETLRARWQADAAQLAAHRAMQHAAAEARACIAQAEAELQARRETEQGARLAAEAALARLAARAAEALPVAAPAPAPAAASPSPSPSPSPKTPEQTLVLVADDSKIVRVKTGRLLAQHRYQIVYAIDGLEAVQQIEASMPDVVITDVDMPGMNGFELTRHVRQNPLTAHIPVIMITAADDKHRVDADRAGVSVLLGKPYPEDELIAHIHRVMNSVRARAGVPV